MDELKTLLLSLKDQAQPHLHEYYKSQIVHIKNNIHAGKERFVTDHYLEGRYLTLNAKLGVRDYDACCEILNDLQNRELEKMQSVFLDLDCTEKQKKAWIDMNIRNHTRESANYVLGQLGLFEDFLDDKE